MQQMTASDPLSLQEEHAMQKSWALDEKKCTFIIAADFDASLPLLTTCLIGDVNLYFNDLHDPKCAEIEVMVAGLLHC